MKSLRARLALLCCIGFVVTATAFIFVLHLTLEIQLKEKAGNKIQRNELEGKLHENLTDAETDEIADTLMKTTLLWLLPLAVIGIVGGYWLARQSLRPIANVNRQLKAKNRQNLGEPISLPVVDYEFRDLVWQLNDLLARLDASFSKMNNYAAKVAHELRTPLAIMRLKLEQAGAGIAPDLADGLDSELHRLTHVVDELLLIARAEQGQLAAERSVFDFSKTITEVVADFQLLAAEQNRHLVLQAKADCWIFADPRHVRHIAHNLLTNALKHGSGDLIVRVRQHGESISLLIANRVQSANGAQRTLGLGLRVVAALLRLEPDMKLQHRHGQKYYLARLLMRAANLPKIDQLDF